MSLVDSFVEIRFKKPDYFAIIRETLTRIGVGVIKDNTHFPVKKLFQSCHILHKTKKIDAPDGSFTRESHYYIVHFKELYKLDGKPTDITQDDIARRNTIANMLAEWKLLELVDPNKTKEPVVPLEQIKIISHAAKKEWILEAKYNIGAIRKTNKPL